jgi:hypothetical protein
VVALLEAQTHTSIEGKWYAPYPRLWAPTRLRHTTIRVVPVLVGQLSRQPLLTLPPEAKLSKVSIPPTMLTMEGFRFWLWFWVLFGLWLLLTQFLTLLSKELIPQVTLELDGFLEVVDLSRKHGWSWGCV